MTRRPMSPGEHSAAWITSPASSCGRRRRFGAERSSASGAGESAATAGNGEKVCVRSRMTPAARSSPALDHAHVNRPAGSTITTADVDASVWTTIGSNGSSEVSFFVRSAPRRARGTEGSHASAAACQKLRTAPTPILRESSSSSSTRTGASAMERTPIR